MSAPIDAMSDDDLWHIAVMVASKAGGTLFNFSQYEVVTEIRASFMDPDAGREYIASRAAEPTAAATPPIIPTGDPKDPLNEFIPLADNILMAVAELRSQLYTGAKRPEADPMQIIDAARRHRLERRLRNEPVDHDRRVAMFDRRARVAPMKS